MKQLTDIWFNSYKEYYKVITKEIKEKWSSDLPIIPFTVVLIDEIETQRNAFDSNLREDFDKSVASFYNIARSWWFKIIIKITWKIYFPSTDI